jgi:hypothetical protein
MYDLSQSEVPGVLKNFMFEVKDSYLRPGSRSGNMSSEELSN